MKHILWAANMNLRIAIICLFAVCACNKEIVPSSEFVSYISAYTGGLIYPSSTIQIELTDAQDVEVKAEIKEKLFAFSPSIKGKAYWLNNRTIEFVPENGALKNGQAYEAEFKLGKVMKVDKRHKTFPFSFKVEERRFDVKEDPLDIIAPATVVASGIIRSSDKIALETLVKAFSATTSDKQTLTPVITATDDPQVFRYTIDGIQRQKNGCELL